MPSSSALINALQILPEDRTRSVEQFRAELSASPTAAYAGEIQAMSEGGDRSAEPMHGEGASAAPKKKKSAAQPFLVAGGITLGVGIIVFAILMATVFRGSFSKKNPGNDQSTLNPSVTESTSTETIVVPDFRNLSYEAISKNPVWDGKFTFKTKFEYSDTVKEGYVISQSLPEQTTVAIGSGNYTDGVVVSMSVEPGSKAPKGTRIELTFSTSNENDVTSSGSSSGGSIFDRFFAQ